MFILSIPLRPTTMETLSTTIKEVLSIPEDGKFKFIIRLTDKVPAMVEVKDKVFEKGESDVVWLTKRELLEAVPVRLRPMVTNEILAYILPELTIELKPVEHHTGDMLGGKLLEHETIVHETINLETAPLELIKEAKTMLA